jgi:hypothetical protein
MWGQVELEPEIQEWFFALNDSDAERVRFHIDRLAELGVSGGRPMRITYWIAPGRRIVLLTVFAKTQRQERREIRRAREAMERCAAEAHTADDEE